MKTIIKYGVAIASMGILANFLFGGGSDKTADISELIKNGALVIDVRSADEFAGGHLAEAVNIPLNIISKDIHKHSATKSQPVILYCFSGGRSAAAKKTLEQMGYTQVLNGGSLSQMRKTLGR